MTAQPPALPFDDVPATPLYGALEWRVRPATAADCDAAALIGQAAFLETYAALLPVAAMLEFCAAEHSADRYRAFLAKGAWLWLAEECRTGVPLGYALMTEPYLDVVSDDPDAFRPAAGDIELKRIYALSRCHGSGLGPALMTTVLDAARTLGRTRVVLGVARSNERALAFYSRNSFAPAGTRHFTVGMTRHLDLVLARRLEL